MDDLQDMLRVQARLHRRQGAVALADLFGNARNEIESLRTKLAKANEAASFYKEQYEKVDRECTKLAMREAKTNERVKELESAVATAIHTFDAYEMDVDTYPTIEHVKLKNGLLAHLNKFAIEKRIEGAEEYTAYCQYSPTDSNRKEWAEQLRKEQTQC